MHLQSTESEEKTFISCQQCKQFLLSIKTLIAADDPRQVTANNVLKDSPLEFQKVNILKCPHARARLKIKLIDPSDLFKVN